MIYLDHAATTPVAREVADTMYDVLLNGSGNPSSQYPYGAAAKKRLEADRAVIAAALGCKPDELYFTSCGTESDNWAIRLAAHQNRRVGKHIITTSLGFLDTFMVGLLGSEQMSAVTVANVPIFIIQLIVFGLQSGSSVLISQYWGRGDRESINRVIGIGLCIAGSVSTLFALIMAFFPADVLLLVTDNLRLVAIGTPYIRIVGFSYILKSLSSIYIGMQRSIENPRFGMLVFGASMLCNTVGNYVLIFGKLGFPALGVTGAAAATLLSRVVEFALAFGYALRCRTVPLQWSALLRPGREMLHRFIHYSAPVLANETLWGVGYSLITVIMGHMAASGDLIAAYTVAGSIDKLSTAGIYGIANAAAVIVGKEIGIGSSRESVVRIG